MDFFKNGSLYTEFVGHRVHSCVSLWTNFYLKYFLTQYILKKIKGNDLSSMVSELHVNISCGIYDYAED
jgi:hypothetical protein